MRGETLAQEALLYGNVRFQSTPLMRGETASRRRSARQATISIHSPHARGDARTPGGGTLRISIHSPHARGDKGTNRFGDTIEISIHSPHARGDLKRRRAKKKSKISIHSPHARGDITARVRPEGEHISIHSPHARGDLTRRSTSPCTASDFNPLPSCEGRHSGAQRPK